MFMQSSPAGRTITPLVGDPDTIQRRGNQITSLGTQMSDSSAFLRALADQTGDQRGQAVEKLREIVGDTYEELGRAADMYRPTGPVLVTYARALADVQPRLNGAVDECRRSWDAFWSAPGFLPGERPPWRVPEDGSDDADAAERMDQAKEDLRDDFVARARDFDREYDTWEDAFETAANGVSEILDGKIEDGFWDDVDGFVASVQTVLSWAGLIVGIAAIIIGGPIVALLGAVVGALALALTIYQAFRGDKGAVDVAVALVGVIPFGSAGKLFQGSAGRLSFLSEMATAFRPSAWSAAIGQGRTLSLVAGMAGGGWRGFVAGGRGLFTMNNPAGVGDVMTRLMFGKNVSGLEEIIGGMAGSANGFCNSTTLSGAWQFTYTLASGSWNMANNVTKYTPGDHPTLNQQYPWVGALA